MSLFSFNVWLDNKLIDTVFSTVAKTQKIKDAVESTRLSLINHDDYNPRIAVTWPKGQRITVDEWELQGNYCGYWDTLVGGTLSEVKANKKDYRENEPSTRTRIVCKRVRL